MGKPIQIVKMDKSILEYFHMVMDLDNESEPYCHTIIEEFQEKIEESLNKASIANIEVVWIKHQV